MYANIWREYAFRVMLGICLYMLVMPWTEVAEKYSLKNLEFLFLLPIVSKTCLQTDKSQDI